MHVNQQKQEIELSKEKERVPGLILILIYYECGVSQVWSLSAWVPLGSPGSSYLPKRYLLVDW